MNAREAALNALMRCRKDRQFSADALESAVATAGLDSRDTAFATRICYGVIQNRSLLDHYIAAYSTVSIKAMEPKVLDILRLSAYQIAFMDRVPVSAAVKEGVDLCRGGVSRASGLVNAVLRRIAENKSSLPEPEGAGGAEYLAVKYSHPLWLAQHLIAERGYDFTQAFFAANNAPVPVTAQVNTLRTTAKELADSLRLRGVDVEQGAYEDSLRLRGAGRISALPEFQAGDFYVQDDAAREVTRRGLLPGMTVLDGCAAPGGKSFAAAIAMAGRGRVIACDLAEKKLPLIREGAERLGLDIIETRPMDARAPDEELIGAADVVIADAPCSGLGVIRKKPEIRWKEETEIARLPEIQYGVLSGLARCVRPGGRLIYSTCTVLRREDQDVAERFLRENREFSLDGEMREFWPQLQETDGFFICSMVKSI